MIDGMARVVAVSSVFSQSVPASQVAVQALLEEIASLSKENEGLSTANALLNKRVAYLENKDRIDIVALFFAQLIRYILAPFKACYTHFWGSRRVSVR